MTSRLVLALATTLVIGLLALADDQTEPPVRLKKKAKPTEALPEKKPEVAPKEAEKKPAAPVPQTAKNPETPMKDGEKKDDPDPASVQHEEEMKEAIARAGKNMKASEDRLARKDTGDATQQIQRDVLKDLDAVIELDQRQQQQQQQSASQSQSKSQQQEKRMKRRQMNQQTRKQEPKAEPRDQKTDQRASKPASGVGKSEKGEKDNLADLYKDVWGHLPETLRLEMDQYARERFMPRYSEMLKQYYSALAEKNRRKGGNQ